MLPFALRTRKAETNNTTKRKLGAVLETFFGGSGGWHFDSR